MFSGRKDDLEYPPHLILFLSLPVISEGDRCYYGGYGAAPDPLLNFKNISLQKFTRSGGILGFFPLGWLEKVVFMEDLSGETRKKAFY